MSRFPASISRSLMGAAALLGSLTGPSIATPAFAAPSWVANDDDALLFEVRLAQYTLGDGVRGYQTPAGACVDLADTIMALDISVRLDKKLRRATGWVFEERRTLTIDREINQAQIMNTRETLGPDAIYDTPEGWCVDTGRLSKWLGVALTADKSNALLIIKANDKLPVQLQLERRERAAKLKPVASFDLKSLPQANAPFRGFKIPSVDAVVTLGGARQQGTTSVSARYELYAAGEIGPIDYNARISSDQRGVPANVRVQAYRTDPDARLLGPLKATQVAAGDIGGMSSALVSQGGAGRGAFISNRPIERSDSFDRTDFRGELPSGWDAELYRNGQLLAIVADRADGRYEFLDVQLLFGQNRFEIVLYGPQGQIRRESKQLLVGAESIPPRQTYFWLGGYQDGVDLIGLGRSPPRSGRNIGSWRGAFGIERGFDTKTSGAFYGQSLVLPSGLRRNYGELSLRRVVGPTLLELSGSGALEGGYAARIEMLGQFGNTNISAESIIARKGFESDRIRGGETGLHRVSVDQAVKLGRTVLPFHAEVNYTTRVDGVRRLGVTARTSLSVGRLSFGGDFNYRSERSPFVGGAADSVGVSLRASGSIARVRIRGETRFSIAPEKRFESASLTGEWSAGRDDRYRSNWRAELGYEGATRLSRVGVGYVRRFEKFALTGTIEARSDGAVAAGLNIAFSLGANPRGGGFRLSSRSLATQGQVLARVYRDRNGDGVRQSDEPLEKDVQMTAGRASVDRLTGVDGQVMIDGLLPFQPVLIGIDTSSLSDPFVQPSTGGLVVTPRPGVAIELELPLVSSGEVDGTLVSQNGQNFEGVDLELIDAKGRVAKTTRSEFDGFFLFDGVPYGRYSLRVANASALAAGIVPALRDGLIIADAAPSLHLGAIATSGPVQRAAAE